MKTPSLFKNVVLVLLLGLSSTLGVAQCSLSGFGGECIDMGITIPTNVTTINVTILPTGTFTNPYFNWTSSVVTLRWPAIGAGLNVDPITSFTTLVDGSPNLVFQEEVMNGALPIPDRFDAILVGNYYYKKFAGTTADNGLALVGGTTYTLFSIDFTTAEASVVIELAGPADPYVAANNGGPSVQTLAETFQGFASQSATYDAPTFPVEWLYFNAEAVSNRDAQLTWATATEGNNNFFQIEKSVDGQLFEPIARAQAVGNSTTTQEYDYLDKDYIASKVFYRLKQVDFDGVFSRSDVVEVNFDPAASAQLQFELFPNPAHSVVMLKPLQRVEGTYRVEIVDVTGRKVWNGIYEEDASGLAIQVGRLAEGIYTVYMVGAKLGSNHLVGRFVKKQSNQEYDELPSHFGEKAFF